MTRRKALGTMAGCTAGAALLAAGVSGARGEVRTEGPVRMGVIGVGRRARSHIAIIKGRPDRCRITALCDIIPERAAAGVELAGGGDIKTFTRYLDLVRSGLCDAVVVATPNYTHKEIAIRALRAGLHVLCEKPMATTLADARAMVDVVLEMRRVFAVGLQFRYAPVYLKVRELLDSGVIGELKYVWAEEFRGDWARLYDDPEVNQRKNWRYFRRLSGGTLVEKNCHDFDILSWLIGANPIRVTASGGTSVYGARETLDHATVAVDYEGGAKLALGVCMFAKVSKAGTTLVGTEGMIEFPRGGGYVIVRRPKKKDERIDLSDSDLDKFGHRGTGALHADFLDAIAAGRPPRADVHVGYSALRIAIAAQWAIDGHQVVDMKRLED